MTINRKALSGTALGVLAVLFVALLLLVDFAFRGARVDLTHPAGPPSPADEMDARADPTAARRPSQTTRGIDVRGTDVRGTDVRASDVRATDVSGTDTKRRRASDE